MISKDEDSFHQGATNPFSLFEGKMYLNLGLAGTLHFLCDLFHPHQALFPGFQTPDDE